MGAFIQLEIWWDFFPPKTCLLIYMLTMPLHLSHVICSTLATCWKCFTSHQFLYIASMIKWDLKRPDMATGDLLWNYKHVQVTPNNIAIFMRTRKKVDKIVLSRTSINIMDVHRINNALLSMLFVVDNGMLCTLTSVLAIAWQSHICHT